MRLWNEMRNLSASELFVRRYFRLDPELLAMTARSAMSALSSASCIGQRGWKF